MAKSYYAGMDLDAPCGRCKSETNHRILSITDGVPEKIICTVCRSTHKFREAKPVKPAAPAGVRVSRGSGAVNAPKPSAPSPSRYHDLMIEEQAGLRAKPYSVTERVESGAWIDHPSFGLGKVQHRSGRKIDVLFRDGLKTLING